MKEQYLRDKIKPIEIFYTFWGWTFFIIVTVIQLIVVSIILIFIILFDRDRKIITYMIKFFCQVFYFLNFVQRNKVDYNNLKKIKKGERLIYVMNHASMFDVILMFILPGPIKSLIKESWTKIPIIGLISVLSGNIILPDNYGEENKLGIYMKLMEKLETGIPLAIFPEGTRSKNGKINKFYSGSFKLALDTKSDVIPVVLDTWNVIRPGGFWIRDTKITIKLLDKIKYENIKDLEYRKITKIVRIKMIEGLINLRDERRKNEKNYYRHAQKYIDIDNEMKEELKKLKQEK